MRTPGLLLALLLTIGLGIGSNISVDGFARGLTRPDSPRGSVARVVSIFEQNGEGVAGPLSYQEYLSLRDRLNVFEWIGAAHVSPANVEFAGHSATMSVAAITSQLAGALNLSLTRGIFISRGFWQSEFHSQADVRGEQVRIDDVNFQVAGVAPDGLDGLYHDHAVDIWLPLKEASQSVDRVDRHLSVFAQLRRDVSTDQAQLVLRASGRGSRKLNLLPYTGKPLEMQEGFARVSSLLSFGAGLVFFIACANAVSLLLGRASARSPETAVRIALGASRGQLARELLADSVIISVVGGAFGILLAMWTTRVLPALLFEQDARSLVFAPNLSGIIVASAACIGITMACGLLPVFVLSHRCPANVLRRESAGPSKAIRHLRTGLVVAQMTSCCMLVIGTAFLFDGLRTALQTSVGRRHGHPILATVQSQADGDMTYFRNVQNATELVTGISGIAWAASLPGSQPEWRSFHIDPRMSSFRAVNLKVEEFTADSLGLFTLPPVAGRLFGAADQTCRVAVANEAAADGLFGAETVGRTLSDSAGLPVEIIGVVAMRRADPPSKRGSPTIYYYAERTGVPREPIELTKFRVPARSKLARAELDVNVVSPSYFVAMGWSLVAGQIFIDDSSRRGCCVGVVNQEAADLYFDGKAVGAAVIDNAGRRTEIIGVVRSEPLGAFQQRVEPAIYFPMVQDRLPRMTLILASREIDISKLDELRRRIESVPGRGRAPLVLQTLETYVSQSALAPLRIVTLIIGASAITALVLSVIGLFGAVRDAARHRRREFAIRIVLGARPRHITRQVLREGGRVALMGALAGTFASVLFVRILARIIPGSSSPALWVWLSAPLALAGVVAIASALPARRASLVSPLAIMRNNN